MKIAMARVALATFETGTKKEDKVDRQYRRDAGKFLGISITNPAGGTDIQDKLHKSATLEHILLGRVGYIMLWNWLQIYGKERKIPLLTVQPCQIQNSLPN